MRIHPFAALSLAVVLLPAAQADARPRLKHHMHRHYTRMYQPAPRDYGYGGYGYGESDPYSVSAYSRTGRVPMGTYGEPVPFRTVQPTDVGIGALAPNGYRGPGTASGGPAGGIDNGGGR